MKKSVLASLLGKTGEQKTFSFDSVLGTAGAVAAATGGVYGFSNIAARYPAIAQKSPYITPAIMIAVGHLLKRVSPAAGYALIGSGATVGVINMESAQAAPAKGIDDNDDESNAGDMMGAGDAGALVDQGRAVLNAGALVDQGNARVEARGFANAGDAGMLIDN